MSGESAAATTAKALSCNRWTLDDQIVFLEKRCVEWGRAIVSAAKCSDSRLLDSVIHHGNYDIFPEIDRACENSLFHLVESSDLAVAARFWTALHSATSSDCAAYLARHFSRILVKFSVMLSREIDEDEELFGDMADLRERAVALDNALLDLEEDVLAAWAACTANAREACTALLDDYARQWREASDLADWTRWTCDGHPGTCDLADLVMETNGKMGEVFVWGRV